MLGGKTPENVKVIRQIQKIPHLSHEKLKNGIDGGRKNFCRGEIQRGIMQGDAFSSLLFVIDCPVGWDCRIHRLHLCIG